MNSTSPPLVKNATVQAGAIRPNARRVVNRRQVNRSAAVPVRRDFLLTARVGFLLRSWSLDMESANRSTRYIGNVTDILDKWLWLAGIHGWERFDADSLRGFLRYVQTGHTLPEGRWGEPGQTRADHEGKSGYPIQSRYREVADSTLLDYYRRIRGFCSWLVKQDYLDYSPLERVTAPLSRSKPSFHVFTQDEARRMEAAARKSKTAARDTALVLFLLDTGLRAEEVTTLTWSQVNLDKDEATFMGKGGKVRSVWWSREVGRALYAWHSEWEPQGSEVVFPSLANRSSGAGMDRGGLRHLLARLGRVAKVARCNPHTFRHAQPLTSPVLTPSGWKTMGELRVGDLVIGSDGCPTPVIGVYPQGQQKTVRLTFDDQATVECTLDHLWTVWEPAVRRWPRYPIVRRVLNTQEIIDSGLRWHFPVVGAVKYEKGEDLPIEPYTLGAMLGDGYFGTCLTLAGGENKAEIRERIAKSLPEGYRTSLADGYCLIAVNNGRPRINEIATQITRLGLKGVTGNEKFIPRMYMTASVADRKAMLQGLMDTDGTATKYSSAEFATGSRQLAFDIQELVRSLGGLARIRQMIPYKGAKNLIYRVAVRTPFNPFYLSRKHDRYETKEKQPFVRSMVKWEPIGAQECVCIEVGNADSLYVTQNYVVTHNTSATMRALSGMEPFVLKEFLGHESIDTTLKYVRFVNNDIGNASRKHSPVSMLRRK